MNFYWGMLKTDFYMLKRLTTKRPRDFLAIPLSKSKHDKNKLFELYKVQANCKAVLTSFNTTFDLF